MRASAPMHIPRHPLVIRKDSSRTRGAAQIGFFAVVTALLVPLFVGAILINVVVQALQEPCS